MMLIPAGLAGCATVDRTHSNKSLTPSPGPTPNVTKTESPNVKIDEAMQRVASEFERRLGYYNGKLLALTVENDRIAAQWSSEKCDWPMRK